MKFVYYMQCKTAAKANFMEKTVKNPTQIKRMPTFIEIAKNI